ncbi:HSP20-like chaperone [Tribonema minus]|uniref:Nuclear migration protein nudC n=1 Tax=Tribonema minus TaxID=303371 RepID=A0A835Z5V7_9STRA|nr:HSP20-like chaperone [Tribonema minus]
MSEQERFDGLFLTLAQQCQGIDPMLESLFSFLRRKTDFFTGASPDKVEQTVLDAIRKQADILEREELKRKKAAEEQAKKRADALRSKKEEKQTQENVEPQVIQVGSDGAFDIAEGEDAAKSSASALSAAPTTTAKAEDEGTNVEKPPEGNGGRTDTYVWTQTLSELSVTIPVPPGTKSRDVVCTISRQHLKAGLKGQPPIVDGDLHKKVIVEDSFWTLEDAREISIALQKDNQMEWWKSVIQGDAEIDTTKVQPENSKLDDLDADTRKTVEKMMFDQRQKAMGLPTADEMQKQELLKKFMDQHPEMDFSKAKIN